MTKKDRLAITISSVVLFLSISVMLGNSRSAGPIFTVFVVPIILYWAYRFIKDDISFLRRNPKTTNDKNIAAIGAKADELLKWNDLLAKGAITQEEYDKAKRDLLG